MEGLFSLCYAEFTLFIWDRVNLCNFRKLCQLCRTWTDSACKVQQNLPQLSKKKIVGDSCLNLNFEKQNKKRTKKSILATLIRYVETTNGSLSTIVYWLLWLLLRNKNPYIFHFQWHKNADWQIFVANYKILKDFRFSLFVCIIFIYFFSLIGRTILVVLKINWFECDLSKIHIWNCEAQAFGKNGAKSVFVIFIFICYYSSLFATVAA